jgi:hypothetical protein
MDLKRSNRAMLVPPGELAGPVPRKVALCSTDATYIIMTALLFFGLGAYSAWSLTSENIQQTRWRALLRTNGREVVGQVTKISWARYGPDFVRYRFAVDGKTYSGETERPRSVGPWDALSRLHPILIRFFPSDPAISHPAAWQWSLLVYLPEIILIAFLDAMSGLMVAGLLRERTLAREGRAAAALVTSCTPQNRVFRLEYEFHTEAGESLKGKSDSQDSYEVGAKIWITYLPRNPKRNHPYPLNNWIVAT